MKDTSEIPEEIQKLPQNHPKNQLFKYRQAQKELGERLAKNPEADIDVLIGWRPDRLPQLEHIWPSSREKYAVFWDRFGHHFPKFPITRNRQLAFHACIFAQLIYENGGFRQFSSWVEELGELVEGWDDVTPEYVLGFIEGALSAMGIGLSRAGRDRLLRQVVSEIPKLGWANSALENPMVPWLRDHVTVWSSRFLPTDAIIAEWLEAGNHLGLSEKRLEMELAASIREAFKEPIKRGLIVQGRARQDGHQLRGWIGLGWRRDLEAVSETAPETKTQRNMVSTVVSQGKTYTAQPCQPCRPVPTLALEVGTALQIDNQAVTGGCADLANLSPPRACARVYRSKAENLGKGGFHE